MPYFSLTLRDSYGRTTKKLIEIEAQADIAGYASLASTVAANWEAVSDLGIVRCDLILPQTATSAVVAGSNVDVGATFKGTLVGTGNKHVSTKLPGIKDTKVNADGTVNPAEADVGGWLNQYKAAGAFRISDGEEVSTWDSGVLDK